MTSPVRRDETPIYADPDPYVMRFDVRPLFVLDAEHAIPIFEAGVWDQLSATRGLRKGAVGWGAAFRTNLREVSQEDGQLLMALLEKDAGCAPARPRRTCHPNAGGRPGYGEGPPPGFGCKRRAVSREQVRC